MCVGTTDRSAGAKSTRLVDRTERIREPLRGAGCFNAVLSMRFSAIKSCPLIVVAAALVACADPDGGADDSGTTPSVDEPVAVEIFSWWTAPGEAEALQVLMDLHKQRRKGARIINAATDPQTTSGGVEAKVVLQERLEAGEPPDSFQTDAFELKDGYLAETPNLLRPLDDLFAEEALADDIVPELLDSVTVDGRLMAVPVNVHRENALFYNKTLFSQHDLEPPKTMADFLGVCAKLKSAGVVPLAISTSESWIISKVFVAIALGTLGRDLFVEYFVDKRPLREADMARVTDVLDEILTEYIDVEGAAVEGFGWTQAADALHEDRAAMFIHGDWAKGYLTHLGWTPGVDFGVVATPDSGGAFLFGTDVFAVPEGAPHQVEALDWLRTVGSPDGQIAFNALKGSSPIRLSLDDSELDPMAKETYADLKNATLRLSADGVPVEWDDGLVELAMNHDRAAFLQILMEHPIE